MTCVLQPQLQRIRRTIARVRMRRTRVSLTMGLDHRSLAGLIESFMTSLLAGFTDAMT